MIKKIVEKIRHIQIVVSCALVIFISLFITAIFVEVLRTILTNHFNFGYNRIVGTTILALTSITMGTIISAMLLRKTNRIIIKISDATKEITSGNYNIRIDDEIRVEELRVMAQNFNTMAQELSSTELLRNDFIENVSHEFKTPINAIEGYATLLQNENIDKSTQTLYIKKIIQSTNRLSTLSNNILLLSKLENQEINLNRELYSLDEQIREVLLSLEAQWSAKNIDLQLELNEIWIFANKSLMFHVWQNLIANAIKFSFPNGCIKIQISLSQTINILIQDNGCGIEQESMERLFEKFYQGDNSRSKEGSGLGLSLVKRIIDLHGGHIEVQSVKGHGSAFMLHLQR